MLTAKHIPQSQKQGLDPIQSFGKIQEIPWDIMHVVKMKTNYLPFLGSETYHHASHLGFYKIYPKLLRYDLLPLKDFVLDMHNFLTKLFWGRRL